MSEPRFADEARPIVVAGPRVWVDEHRRDAVNTTLKGDTEMTLDESNGSCWQASHIPRLPNRWIGRFEALCHLV